MDLKPKYRKYYADPTSEDEGLYVILPQRAPTLPRVISGEAVAPDCQLLLRLDRDAIHRAVKERIHEAGGKEGEGA